MHFFYNLKVSPLRNMHSREIFEYVQESLY